MATINLPFPIFKSTGDDKRDMEIYEEDLRDYCTRNNWYDPSKQSEAEKWVKADKAIACLRSSLTPSARTVFKYSLGLSEAEQKKLHLVLQALREYYGASIGVSGERQKFLRLLQQDGESISSWESRIRNQSAQCEYESFEDELMRFASEYGFKSIKSSPYHSRSNGKAESAVKVAKNILKKARHEDPYLALLAYRNTPQQGHTYSPAERIMSRKLRDITVSIPQQLKPYPVSSIGAVNEIISRRNKSKEQYDKRASSQPLDTFSRNDQVYVKPNPKK